MVLALYVKSQPPASMLYQLSHLVVWCLLASADDSAGAGGATASAGFPCVPSVGPAPVRWLGVFEVEPLDQGYALGDKLRVDAREIVEPLREGPAGEDPPDLVDAQLKEKKKKNDSVHAVQPGWDRHTLAACAFRGGRKTGFLIG